MENRHIALIVFLGIGVGLVFGGLGAALWSKQASAAPSNVVELGAAEQNDFIIMTAEAFASDGDRSLALDRLARLHEPNVAVHVANLAARYAPQGDLLASNLALLAVAVGSKDASLIALSMSSTPPPTPTATPNPTETPTVTASVLPSATSTLEPTFTPTPPPTVTPTATRRPPTRVPPTPTATMTSTPTTAPPPATEFDPWNMSDWPPGITFWPANVTAGTTYWHLTKAIYCDFTETNYQCPSLPGGE